MFLSNIGEEQKKSYDLSAGPLTGIAPNYGKSGPDLFITFIKRLNVGLRQQLISQKPYISIGLYV